MKKTKKQIEAEKKKAMETMPDNIDKELAYKYGRCLHCQRWYGACKGH